MACVNVFQRGFNKIGLTGQLELEVSGPPFLLFLVSLFFCSFVVSGQAALNILWVASWTNLHNIGQ